MESKPHRSPARTPLRTAAALLLLGVALACGCSSRFPTSSSSPGPFTFEHDTFAFANQTYWVYQQDPATGRMSHLDRNPPPDFAHRCFVLVRAAREFKLHARFDPAAPPASEHDYRDAVRRIVRRSSRHPTAPADRVVIPGYPDLRSFSAAHEQWIQDEVGGAWQSYVQRGHWRMVLPFPDSHRERTARNLAAAAAAGSPTAVHVVDFPGLAINHALLVYGV
ncbi:MAG: hypothetical protein Q7T30_00345, partial [Planctomycetota bacterium]|nr:hypothetical protein [Planctomycetota bacterium]